MIIHTLPLGLIAANCYMLECEDCAIVIDPGKYSEKVRDFLEENADKHRIILLTHAHFDHIGGAARLREETGVSIAVCKDDASALGDTKINLSDRFHARLTPFSADILLSDGQTLMFGNTEIKAIATPGHTPGGMCFFINGCLFSGDTLFLNSIGRTDHYCGDEAALLKSVRKIVDMFDGEVQVYAGHGQPTTIEHEKNYNPYL